MRTAGETPHERWTRLMNEDAVLAPAVASKGDLPHLLSFGKRREATVIKHGVTIDKLKYHPLDQQRYTYILTRNVEEGAKFPTFQSDDDLRYVGLKIPRTGELLALALPDKSPARTMYRAQWNEYNSPGREAMRNASELARVQRECERAHADRRVPTAPTGAPPPEAPPMPKETAPQGQPETPPFGWRRPAIVNPNSLAAMMQGRIDA